MFNTELGTQYFYHDGNTKVGFNSLCTLYPARQLGIFIIANDVQSQEKVGKIENALVKALR